MNEVTHTAGAAGADTEKRAEAAAWTHLEAVDEANMLLRRMRATAFLMATNSGAELLDGEAINAIGDTLQDDIERLKDLVGILGRGAPAGDGA